MLRKLFTALLTSFFALISAATIANAEPSFSIWTTSPVFDDADGRVAHMTYEPYPGHDAHCSASSLGDGYWLSNAHCFYSEGLSQQAIDARVESATLHVGRPGDQKQSSIEELIFFPGAKEFHVDEYGNRWHRNDLVMFKTSENIASGGFNLDTNGYSHPVGAPVRISGSGSNWQRNYPSAIDIPVEAEVIHDTVTNRVHMLYDSFSATCSGDSGGAAYDNANKTLYGILTSDNSRAANQPCVEVMEQKYMSSYTTIGTPDNLAFINQHHGNLGSDKPAPPATSDTSGISGGSSLSSSR